MAKTIQDYEADFDIRNQNSNKLIGANVYIDINNSCSYKIYDDDPIVNIIPKYYFTHVGEKSFVGKEYGFYISTEFEQYRYNNKNYTTNNYRSRVIVFDIFHSNADAPDLYSLGVKVLFCSEFITVQKNEEYLYRQYVTNEKLKGIYQLKTFAWIVDKSKNEYTVAPLINNSHSVKCDKYYLADPALYIGVENLQAMNAQEEGYNAYDDEGFYITSSKLAYNAFYYDIAQNQEKNFFKDEFLNIVKSFIGGFDAFNPLIIAYDIIKVANEYLEPYPINKNDISSNELEIQYNYIDKVDQIKNYGFLVKAACMQLSNVSSYNLLLSNGNYARMDTRMAPGNHKNTGINYLAAFKVVDDKGKCVSIVSTSINEYIENNSYDKLNNEFNDIYVRNNYHSLYSLDLVDSSFYDIKIIGLSGVTINIYADDELVFTKEILSDEDNLGLLFEQGKHYRIIFENGTNYIKIGSMTFEIAEYTNEINLDYSFITKVSPHEFKKMYFWDLNSNMISHDIDIEIIGDDKYLDSRYKSEYLYYASDTPYFIRIINRKKSNIKISLMFSNLENHNIVEGGSGKILVNNSNIYMGVKAQGKLKFTFDSSEFYYDVCLYVDNTKVNLTPYYNEDSYSFTYYFDNDFTYYLGLEGIDIRKDQMSSKEMKTISWNAEKIFDNSIVETNFINKRHNYTYDAKFFISSKYKIA